MKKVLVTGGTGAIGRHTVKELLKMGYKVDVLSTYGTEDYLEANTYPENMITPRYCLLRE